MCATEFHYIKHLEVVLILYCTTNFCVYIEKEKFFKKKPSNWTLGTYP